MRGFGKALVGSVDFSDGAGIFPTESGQVDQPRSRQVAASRPGRDKRRRRETRN
jgi:hypothetical protein